MDERVSSCPACGHRKLTTIALPRPHAPSEEARTRRAFRCLECDAQWADEQQWDDLHRAGDGSGEG